MIFESGTPVKSGNPYDSVIIKVEKGDEYDGINVIVFEPTQIKSAIGNKGTFDPSSGSILESAVQPNQKPTIAQDQSRKAMKFTLDTQKNTMEGASRPDIGWIAFLWGNTGTAPLFADGDGLARIIAKQDFEKKYLPGEQSGHELCMRLVDIVTRGHIKRKYGPTSRPKIDFSWQGEVATVSWEPARKTWYLSAWREDWGGVLESALPVESSRMIKLERLYELEHVELEKHPYGSVEYDAILSKAGDIREQLYKETGHPYGNQTEEEKANIIGKSLLTTMGIDAVKKQIERLELDQTKLHKSQSSEVPGRVAVGRKAHRSNKLGHNAIQMEYLRAAARSHDAATADPIKQTVPTAIDVDGLRVAVSIDRDQAKENKVPDSWIVFNAPRPLAGDIVWKGEFAHGSHYAAVDPNGERAAWMVSENKGLDGWIYQFVDTATVKAVVRQEYIDTSIDGDPPVDEAMSYLDETRYNHEFGRILDRGTFGQLKAILAKANAPDTEAQESQEIETKYRIEMKNLGVKSMASLYQKYPGRYKEIDEMYDNESQDVIAQYREKYPSGVIALTGQNREKGVLIHRSSKHAGKYQLSYWDKKGFSGDMTFDTEAEAVREAFTNDGYRHFGKEAFSEISQSDGFKNGIDAARKMQDEFKLQKEAPDASGTIAPSVAITEQWRLDIRNAKTFQDIADVFEREFGVTVDNEPVTETAILEGWEDDLVNPDGWKDKLRAATTFDDIYLAFKASGIMSEDMPNKPQDAAILFDYADKIGKLIADFSEAENSTERIGNLETKNLLVTEIRNRGYGFNSVFPLLSEDQKYQYRNIPPLVTLQAAAGKEIFEAAKAKGASIVEAWQAGPDYERNRKHAADIQAAILLVESGHKELSDRYHASTKAIEDLYGFEQIHNDYAGETVVAEKERNRLENNLSSLAAFTPEWVLAKAQLEDARAACAAVVVKHGKMYDDICRKIYDSEEYRSIGKEYEIHSELYSKQKKRLKADAEDLESLLYGGLTQKILETSPITIEQSNQWAKEQMIDKSALATLKKQGYLETEIRKDMAELFRLSGGRFGKCYLQPRFKGQSRACAETNQKIIHIGAEFTKRTLWHEMGHLFESDAKYTHVSQSFLDGRVDKAKGLLHLSELTGNKNYRKDEVAFTDHLFDAYVGKYYGPNTSTEVMSMGVQQFSSPELMSELHKSDPEMFHVIIGILATPPSDSEKEKFTGDLKLAKAITDASKPIDAFYKMLDKKIKQNPDFYEPFATFQSVSGHRKTGNSDGYYIISNGFDSYGHYIFQFSAKSKQIVLQIAYLYLVLEQSTQGDGATRDFKDWGQFNVINKDSIPATIANVPSWVTDGLPDIKAA